MRTVRFSGPEPFLDRALPFLMVHEAANNLLIAVPSGMKEAPPGASFWTVSQDGGRVVGAAMHTPPYSLGLSWPFSEDALPDLVDALVAEAIDLPGVLGASDIADRLVRLWGRRSPAGLWRMRIYRSDQVERPSGVPGRISQATAEHREMLSEWFEAAHTEMRDPIGVDTAAAVAGAIANGRLYLWEGTLPEALEGRGGGPGVPVSMAAWTRPTPNGACITMVYTPPDLRRRGYASALVAALSQRLLAEGKRFCCLFTDLANPTSNSIYQRIGYRPVLDLHHYRF